MISKIPSCLAKICQETALAFKKTNGRKAIAQCAKELGVETEVLANYKWPATTMNRGEYATVKFAQAIDLEPSSIALKALNKTFNINAAVKAYSIK